MTTSLIVDKPQRAANNMAFHLLKLRYGEENESAAILVAEKIIQAFKEAS